MTIDMFGLPKKYRKDNLKNLLIILFPNENPTDKVIYNLCEKFNSGELSMIRIMEIKRKDEWYNTLNKISRSSWIDYEFSDDLV